MRVKVFWWPLSETLTSSREACTSKLPVWAIRMEYLSATLVGPSGGSLVLETFEVLGGTDICLRYSGIGEAEGVPVGSRLG